MAAAASRAHRRSSRLGCVRPSVSALELLGDPSASIRRRQRAGEVTGFVPRATVLVAEAVHERHSRFGRSSRHRAVVAALVFLLPMLAPRLLCRAVRRHVGRLDRSVPTASARRSDSRQALFAPSPVGSPLEQFVARPASSRGRRRAAAMYRPGSGSWRRSVSAWRQPPVTSVFDVQTSTRARCPRSGPPSGQLTTTPSRCSDGKEPGRHTVAWSPSRSPAPRAVCSCTLVGDVCR